MTRQAQVPRTHTENDAENNMQMPTMLWDLQDSISNNIHGINVMTIIYNYLAILRTTQANAHITTGGTYSYSQQYISQQV